jgi:hypothetical protein
MIGPYDILLAAQALAAGFTLALPIPVNFNV